MSRIMDTAAVIATTIAINSRRLRGLGPPAVTEHAAVIGVERTSQHVDLGLRLADADARTQPPFHAEPIAIAVVEPVALLEERGL